MPEAASREPSILYITQNGITDHIGRSQVAPYVLGLARKGYGIHVLSAEKPGNEELIANYRDEFDEAGIRWTQVTYFSKPALLGQVRTQIAMEWVARKILECEPIQVLHCRSFPAALIGHRLKKRFSTKYIFDFRDFYADGGLDKAHGLAWLAYRYFKSLERPMIQLADKVVCLTHHATEVLSNWYLQDDPNSASRFTVIPCCADFQLFNLEKISAEARKKAQERAGLIDGEFVLLYLGSLGPDYLLDEMISLFRQVQGVQPSTHFLFVCNNGQGLVEEAFKRQGVDLNAIHFVTVDRTEVPAYIALADLSVIFIRPALAKAGCSPTKLAELFACNVPVIANNGVGDLDRILDVNTNGSVTVADFSNSTLRRAVEQVLNARQANKLDIRTASHEFRLEEGVRRYAAVYSELLGDLNEPELTC